MNFGRYAIRVYQLPERFEQWNTIARPNSEESAIRKARSANQKAESGTAIHCVWDSVTKKEIYRRGFIDEKNETIVARMIGRKSLQPTATD